MNERRYVLISACRNESQYIDGLIATVAAQTFRPLHWVIIDDGSTDDTYMRAKLKTKDLPFIIVIKMPNDQPRSFMSQVYAAQRGYEIVSRLDFEFLGFLDADIRLEENYYEQLVAHLQSNPKLGLVGGMVVDKYKGRIDLIRRGSEDYHVAGGVQFFRRQCYDQIGGYVPIEGGGQDTIADFMSMMRGWEVKTLPEITATHLRPDGFTKQGAFHRGVAWGRKFYFLGYHPLYYTCQCLRRIHCRPILFDSVCKLFGFFIANIIEKPRTVPEEFIQFLRREQLQRIKKILKIDRL